jgi:hypothetical protein
MRKIFSTTSLCALAWVMASQAQAGLLVTWDTAPVLQMNNSQQVFNPSIDADAEEIFFRADSGEIQIQDLQLQTLDGNTMALSDLLEMTDNSIHFGSGIVDNLGDGAYPRILTLMLPSRVHLVALQITAVSPNGLPGSMYVSVLASNLAPVPPPVAPPVTPVAGPVQPTPAPSSGASCDLGALNQQIGMCQANQQNNQSTITALYCQESQLQGEIAGMSYISANYNACVNSNQNVNAQLQALEGQAAQLQDQKQSLDADTKAKQAVIVELSGPQPKGYVCWIVERHGHRYESRGLGTQMDVLRPLLTNANETGAGNIGKQNWKQDGNWGCTPQ